MTRYFVALAATAAICFSSVDRLIAQTLSSTVATNPEAAMASDPWTPVRYGISGSRLLLVTLAEPTKKRSCRKPDVTASSISCFRHLGRNPLIYKKEDIQAVIVRGYNGRGGVLFLEFLGVGAAAVTGAVLLTPALLAVAIPLYIAGGSLVLMSPLAPMADDGNTPDSLLYLKVGQTLQVKLKTN